MLFDASRRPFGEEIEMQRESEIANESNQEVSS